MDKIKEFIGKFKYAILVIFLVALALLSGKDVNTAVGIATDRTKAEEFSDSVLRPVPTTPAPVEPAPAQ